MFYRYEIKNNGKEDVLYLYLTMSYEFSRELTNNSSDKDITRRAKNFINNKGINYNGTKVYLVVDDIIVKSIDISPSKEDIEVLKDSLYYSNKDFLVTLKLEDDSFIEITLKEYLEGAIANNLVPNLNIEVLKAMAVLFRTYAYKEMNEKKFINIHNSFVMYKHISYYKLLWYNDYDKNIEMIDKAIDSTDCIFATYNNQYILPFFHVSNNGSTKAKKGYSYLENISSLWDFASPYYIDVKDYSYSLFATIFKCSKEDIFNMKINIVDKQIVSIDINHIVYNVDTIKKLLNLKSNDIIIIINKESIRFITKGFGEFYGLSLYGANEISKNGCDYLNIIKYYYPKITFNKYIKELS